MSLPIFFGALLLLFAGKEPIIKDFLTVMCRNLTVEVLFTDNDSMLRFEALTDLRTEINVRLPNFIFANQEKECLDMKTQAEEILKEYGFFGDKVDNKKSKEEIDKKTPYFDEPYFPDDVVIDKVRDSEIEDIDDRKTIPYLSPRTESDNELMKKLYDEQDQIDKVNIIRTELEINKANIEASKDREIKKIQDVFAEVKQGEPK